MGQLLILTMTSFLFIILIVRNRRLERGLFLSLHRLIKEINRMYRYLFLEKSLISRLIQCGLVILAELTTFSSIYMSLTRFVEIKTSYMILEPIVHLLLAIGSLLIVHYAIGYVLLFSSKIHLFIYRVESKHLKLDFLLSYAMISTYLQVLILFPEQFTTYPLISLLGMGVCYYLNVKTLIRLMINPKQVKAVKQTDVSFSRVIIAALLILLMIIINLYLMVCLVANLGGDAVAYTNANDYFDLFYYTIITFTTIGYGDIVPLTIPAKIISMLISVTSVVCLSVFLGNVLSYEETKIEE